MRKKIFACMVVLPTLGFAQSSDVDEKKEVVRLFDALIPKFDVKKGDGLGSNMACVFSRNWDQSYHRDADGEPTDAFQPRALLTFEQALDSSGQHRDMFCDYSDRDTQAQRLAQDTNKIISVASIGFSYPDFEPSHKIATVYYQRWSQIFQPGKLKILPVGSNGMITFRKVDGVWSFQVTNLGTMN